MRTRGDIIDIEVLAAELNDKLDDYWIRIVHAAFRGQKLDFVTWKPEERHDQQLSAFAVVNCKAQ